MKTYTIKFKDTLISVSPNAVAELLIVIDSFANFAFAIEPASFAFVKVPGAKSALARPPSAISVDVIDSSVNPFVVTFVNDITLYPNAAGVGTPPDDTNGCSANAHINMVSEPPFTFWLLPLILTPLLTKSKL